MCWLRAVGTLPTETYFISFFIRFHFLSFCCCFLDTTHFCAVIFHTHRAIAFVIIFGFKRLMAEKLRSKEKTADKPQLTIVITFSLYFVVIFFTYKTRLSHFESKDKSKQIVFLEQTKLKFKILLNSMKVWNRNANCRIFIRSHSMASLCVCIHWFRSWRRRRWHLFSIVFGILS